MNRCTVGGRWTLSEGDHVVVGDVEGEREVVTAPAFDIERIVLVVQRCRATVVDEPDLVLVAPGCSWIGVGGARFRDDDLRGVEREMPAELARGRDAELVTRLDHQHYFLLIVVQGAPFSGEQPPDVPA
jgi:hypothetical protein